MKRSVYCLAQNEEQVNHIIGDLHSVQVSDDSISVLYAAKEGKSLSTRTDSSPSKEDSSANFTFEKGTKSTKGAVSAATTGGVIGGALGLLAGLGTIALPGIGTLMATGPLLSTLSGIAVGSISGGIAGSLTAAQVPEYYVKQASKGIEEGRILIAVNTGSKEDAKRISGILEKDGATDVSISSI
jgi:uncharacterized membrane protein